MHTKQARLFGVLGDPVDHSLSPAMHNAAFGAAQIDAIYVPFPAADADDFMTFARAVGLRGASVTIPFKVPLFDRMDEVYSVARRIGAINTIRVIDGRWVGGNTDVSGFLTPLKDRVALKGARAAVLGAGGSARAVAAALSSSQAQVTVYARNSVRAHELATSVSGTALPMPPEPESWDLLVNCTPVGMHPHVDETPIDAALLTGPAGRHVYDLVYNPTSTRLLREAKTAGCQTIGGLEMLVAQATEQFEWWTGRRPAPGIMREAALKRLAAQRRFPIFG